MTLPPPRPVLWPLRPVDTATVTDRVLDDGRRRITVEHAPLRGVSPAMLAWWYGHVDGDMVINGHPLRRYLMWHPLDHISYDVLRPGADGAVGPGARLRIREAFQRRPERLLDVTVDVERVDAQAAVVARHVLGRTVLRLVNAFTPVAGGVRYRSEMTIGTTGRPGARGLNRMLRSRVLPGERAHQWARHHIEEIGNLEHFLPALYGETTGA